MDNYYRELENSCEFDDLEDSRMGCMMHKHGDEMPSMMNMGGMNNPMMHMPMANMPMMNMPMDECDYYYDYMKYHCMYMSKMHAAHAYHYECLKYMKKMKESKECKKKASK